MLKGRTSRPRSAKLNAPKPKAAKQNTISLEELINKRDFSGAITYIQFNSQNTSNSRRDSDASSNPKHTESQYSQWHAYCAFHLGDYDKALEIYENLYEVESDPVYHLYLACCFYFLDRFDEALESAQKGPPTRLQNRLLLNIWHKKKNENEMMTFHSKITDTTEDQLSLAGLHYARSHFQDAYDVYKKEWLDNREQLALQIFVGFCFYQLDRHDTSNEIIQAYLQRYPNSILANNLKACNQFRLYNGKLAEEALKPINDAMSMLHAPNPYFELIRHNLVVFRDGESALEVLPPLIDLIPEARMNLTVHHLRNGDFSKAYQLVKDLQPTSAVEYILKAVVAYSLGDLLNSEKELNYALKVFRLVGESESETNTIAGRQSMACHHLLLSQFENALIYLESIKEFCSDNDSFHYNYGIALTQSGRFSEGEIALLTVNSEPFKIEYSYLSHLVRCYIMNGKSWEAWQLYLESDTNDESWQLLYLIANDCYKVGAFYYAAKAFDALQSLEDSNAHLTAQYWNAKRGAICGVFQLVIANKAMKQHLFDCLQMLQNDTNPQSSFLFRVIKQYCRENGIDHF